MAKRLKHRDRISDLTIDISVTDLQKARDYIAAYPERVLQSARRAANKSANAVRNQSFRERCYHLSARKFGDICKMCK